MSYKAEQEKLKEGYPFTARQRREGSRKSRKQARPGHAMSKIKKK